MNFTDLFILDVANNHEGSVDHGLQTIQEHAYAIHRNAVRAAIKFQFRNDEHWFSQGKHAERFRKTRLSPEQYAILYRAVRDHGLLTACTPFDEKSVELAAEMGFDFLKVASCSAKDWPLIEAVAETKLPVVFSTGGLTVSEIDALANFAASKTSDFALMHCVSIYPMPECHANLRNIAMLRDRYDVPIGWSTHEDPDNLVSIPMAVAYGAQIFERHIGLGDTINGYSSTPKQLESWLQAWNAAKVMAGRYDRNPSKLELDTLAELKRSAAHPFLKEISSLLESAAVKVPTSIELSHHAGMENFHKTGCTFITHVDCDFCKKTIVQLPGQYHPVHKHKRKTEWFQVLKGDFVISINGQEYALAEGESALVPAGTWHAFRTVHGCVVEEISTKNYPGDSIYKDEAINRATNRKTVVSL